VTTAEANYTNAKINYERFHFLQKSGSISKEKYDDTIAAFQVADAAVCEAKAKLELANLDLSYTTVRAPFTGKTGIAPYHVGELVNQQSKPLIHLTMLNPIRIEFTVNESVAVTMLQMHDANFKKDKKRKEGFLPDLIPTLTLSNGTKYKDKGVINFINNKINSSTGTYLMRARFPNPKAIILPGSYVNVTLSSKEKAKSILIPQVAIQQDLLGKYVFTVDKKNIVNEQRITTGEVYSKNILVKTGLKNGEIIIISGLQKIHPGGKVAPVFRTHKQ
jgi:membrane fusion protein, multidrug efflux system